MNIYVRKYPVHPILAGIIALVFLIGIFVTLIVWLVGGSDPPSSYQQDDGHVTRGEFFWLNIIEDWGLADTDAAYDAAVAACHMGVLGYDIAYNEAVQHMSDAKAEDFAEKVMETCK